MLALICGFCIMKRLELFLLPPGWDASPLNSPPALNSPVLIYTPEWIGESHCERGIVLPKNTTQCLWPGLEPGPLDPEASALTMRLLRLHNEWTRIFVISRVQTPREKSRFDSRDILSYFPIYLEKIKATLLAGWSPKDRNIDIRMALDSLGET